jgi:ABC-type transport system substrate-binding protein
MAIDRDSIAKSLYGTDLTDPYWYMPTNMGKWAMKPSDLSADTLGYYKYNPTEAKKLLQAAGVDKREYKIIHWAGNSIWEPEAQAIASMLSSIGVKTTTVGVDYARDLLGGGKGALYGNYDKDSLVLYANFVYEEADQFIYTPYSSKSAGNTARLKDPDVDTMITKARSTLNEDERVKAYLDIQKYLAGKAYSIAGFREANLHTFLQPRVRGYQWSYTWGNGTESDSKLWLQQ